MSKVERFRFDDQTGTVYEYSKEHDAYLFCISYLAADIKSKDRESTKITKTLSFLTMQKELHGYEE
jgi:hypothetical protein